LTDEVKKIEAPKPRTSVIKMTFHEGLREVTIDFESDEGTLTPRKIEHATRLLLKAYRERLGHQQAAIRRNEMAKAAAEQKLAEEQEAIALKARHEEERKAVELQEKVEFERLKKKFSSAPTAAKK
jgi:hypothetical protein